MNKNDLKQIAIVTDSLLKKRLEVFATKDDLAKFATKDDLAKFATKDDLAKFATKDDLETVKKELIDRMDELEVEIIVTVDKHKADKEVVEELEKRIEKLESSAF